MTVKVQERVYFGDNIFMGKGPTMHIYLHTVKLSAYGTRQESWAGGVGWGSVVKLCQGPSMSVVFFPSSLCAKHYRDCGVGLPRPSNLPLHGKRRERD